MLVEMTIPVELGGETYTMRFNANTMAAYETATGEFFMDTVASLYEVVFPKGHLDDEGKPVVVRIKGLDIVRKISMVKLRALLWSSIHDYNAADEPAWPMTLPTVGRHLNFQNIPSIFIKFLTGVSSNSPSKDELGKSPAAPQTQTATAEGESTDQNTQENGGEAGIKLPAGALD